MKDCKLKIFTLFPNSENPEVEREFNQWINNNNVDLVDVQFHNRAMHVIYRTAKTDESKIKIKSVIVDRIPKCCAECEFFNSGYEFCQIMKKSIHIDYMHYIIAGCPLTTEGCNYV